MLGPLRTRPAASCSRRCSDAPVRLFPAVAEVPGNLIYFKVLVADPGRLQLVTVGGQSVPANVRRIGDDRVFAPEQPRHWGPQHWLVGAPSAAGGRALLDPAAQELALALGHACLVQERHGSLDGGAQPNTLGEAMHVSGRVEHDTARSDGESDLRISLRVAAETMPLDYLMRGSVRNSLWLTSWRAEERPDEHQPGSNRSSERVTGQARRGLSLSRFGPRGSSAFAAGAA